MNDSLKIEKYLQQPNGRTQVIKESTCIKIETHLRINEQVKNRPVVARLSVASI